MFLLLKVPQIDVIGVSGNWDHDVVGGSSTLLTPGFVCCRVKISPTKYYICSDFLGLNVAMSESDDHISSLASISSDEQLSDGRALSAQRAAKRSPIVITGKKRKPMKDFLMVIMASGIARGCVRMMITTTAVATESRNMAAVLQKNRLAEAYSLGYCLLL